MALHLVRPFLRRCKHPWRPLVASTSGLVPGLKLHHCQQPCSLLHSESQEQSVKVEKLGSCAVIHLNFGENRLTSAFLKAFHEALDEAEGYEDAKAVVTIGEGKHYSLGLDLEGMALMGWEETLQHFGDIQKLQARLLTFPLVTVAAINGHIYAGGAFLAFAQDYTIMRKDRGWFCLPEINLKKNFPAAWLELAKACLPVTEHKLAIVLGKRYTGEEAKAAGIVNEVSSPEELKDSAIAAANKLAGDGLDRKTLATLKYDLYRDVYRALNEPVRFYSML